MTDPKYPDGAPEWYKPYMECEFSDWVDYWQRKGKAIFCGKGPSELQWIWIGEEGAYTIFKYARPVQPWTPKVGEEVIAWDGEGGMLYIGIFKDLDKKYLVNRTWWEHVARLHNEDGSCIDVSGGIEAIKTRTPWV